MPADRQPARQSGSTARPFEVRITTQGVAEPLASCTCSMRRRPVAGASPVAIWGPVAALVPQDGVCLYYPSSGEATQDAGAYEYKFSGETAAGRTFHTPWIYVDIQ